MLIKQRLNEILHIIYYRYNSVANRITFRRRNKHSQIGLGVQVIGIDNVKLGENVTLSDGVWININNRKKQSVLLSIGDNAFVGRNNFFTVGSNIELHDWFFSSVNCKFIGSMHEKNPLNPYILNDTELNNSIIIESNVFLGAGVTVIGNVTIGYGSIIGADSLVTKSIPPLSIAVGRPAVVKKRYDLSQERWIDSDEYNEEVKLPSEKEYLEMINKVKLSKVMTYHASTNKGWL